MLRVALFAVLLGAVSESASAQSPQSFDGNWLTTVACGPTADGTRGYNLNFWAQVANGMLRGMYGTEGQPPWLRLEGPIAPDGSATLIAQGQSGDPDYAVGRVRTGSRVNYRVQAQFSGSRGSGRRLDNRPCDLTFVRQ
jgi:hypothetical protein